MLGSFMGVKFIHTANPNKTELQKFMSGELFGADRTIFKPRQLFPQSFDPCTETRNCHFLHAANTVKIKQSHFDSETGLILTRDRNG